MKLLKCKLVDAFTGLYTNGILTENGLTLPAIPWLDIKLVYSETYYGICNDDNVADTDVFKLSGKNTILTEAELISELKVIFEVYRQNKLTEIWALAKAKRAQYTGEYHPVELTAGLSKYTQAILITSEMSDIEADAIAPIIAAEATERGITTRALSVKIINQYNSLMMLEATIGGYTGKLADTIRSVTWEDTLLWDNFNKFTIDITDNWPV